MSEENIIGTIEGTATFEKVIIRPAGEDSEKVHVEGRYVDDTTIYSAPEYSVKVGGVTLGDVDGEFSLLPSDEIDGWVWVEATEEELRITTEKPD